MGALVDGLDGASSIDTIRLVGERLGDGAVIVAVETTIHGLGVDVGRALLPLGHDHAGLASIRAVRARRALLIRAHGPSAVALVGSNGDEVVIVGRELAGAAFGEANGSGLGLGGAVHVQVVVLVLAATMVVKVPVSDRGIGCGSENQGSRPDEGLKRLELHGCDLIVGTV